MEKKNVAVIFAGGIGSRMTDASIPKQFLEWNGKAIIVQTLEIFEQHEDIDAIILACNKEWIEYASKLINEANLKKIASIISGGETALKSQYNALKEAKKLFPKDKVIVLIHDGVRPLVDNKTICDNINSVIEYGSAITIAPAIETIIVSENNVIKKIIDRNMCSVAKAPQSFWLDDIIEVYDQAIKNDNQNFIDSASMMLAYNKELHVVAGQPENIKITTPSDYYMYLGISKNRNK